MHGQTHPLGPTIATLFPAGTFRLNALRHEYSASPECNRHETLSAPLRDRLICCAVGAARLSTRVSLSLVASALWYLAQPRRSRSRMSRGVLTRVQGAPDYIPHPPPPCWPPSAGRTRNRRPRIPPRRPAAQAGLGAGPRPACPSPPLRPAHSAADSHTDQVSRRAAIQQFAAQRQRGAAQAIYEEGRRGADGRRRINQTQ